MMKQSTRNQSFFALVHLLQASNRVDKRFLRAHAAAAGIVESEILPILATALEAFPNLSVAEVLEGVRPALIDVLQHVIER